MRISKLLFAAAAWAAACVVASATPEFVEHIPTTQAYGEASGITMREPDVPREDEAVVVWARIGYSFYYTDVAIYYTTDGSVPAGSKGVGSGTTQVLRSSAGQVSFVRNEPSGPGNIDWWKGTLPSGARAYGQRVRYTIGAWHSAGGPEIYSNNYGCADGTCNNPSNTPTIAEYTNKLAWPGAGAGQGNPSTGYPPVSFWKEEAVFGNTYTAGMIDQNGTVYDMHFPTPGGVQGVGTRNEGYVDGLDTFPPGLPQAWRGQMHLNQAMLGIRVDGLTHWLSNPNAVSFSDVQQSYVPRTNTISTTQRLTYGGNNITVEQTDFAPTGIAFPNDLGGNPQRHIYIKRVRLTNNTGVAKTVNVYWYVDPALNGGDGYDGMYFSPTGSAMVAYDNTYRVVTGTGTGFTDPNEYNPTTFSGYEKDRSVYLASAMKLLTAIGSVETTATDSWRDTSGDNGQGWIGMKVFIGPGVSREVDVVMAGAMDDFAGATETYNFQLAPVMTWFYAQSMLLAEVTTNAWWSAWLDSGVTVDTPDDSYDALMERGLLATALHVDGVNGGVIAGFHNGAYPYVWPRDAVYAAVTLARTGHLSEAAGVYEWMRDTTYRDTESWGRKGFWKQKYTTDGYVVWGAPQVDETAVFPWGVWFQYQMTGDLSFLSAHASAVKDAVLAMSSDSIDSRLRFEEAYGLMYSNNVWEDSYDTFVYSNANVVRGLSDAAQVFTALGQTADAADAAGRAATIKGGLDGRLDWNGENTDVSALGVSYPFAVYSPDDERVAKVVDRINGVATDRYGNNHPLVNYSGEHSGTINRYWGDTYWNGGPWMLSTLWYGLYYSQRADLTAGKGDIDNHKQRVDLCIDRLGPAGLGSEQIAYGTGGGASLLYPGQQDFKLQAAWPNAWESMSTFVDGVMAFLGYVPEAPANTMHFRVKLPTDWTTAAFKGITLKNTAAGWLHRVDLVATETNRTAEQALTNRTGFPLQVETVIRVPVGRCVSTVTVNGVGAAYSWNADIGAVDVATPLETGPNAVTTITVTHTRSSDFDGTGFVDFDDFIAFVGAFEAGDDSADFDESGFVDFDDFNSFVQTFESGC